MTKVSACIVAWNGEKQIRGCLESLKGAVDEIIVVHDGPCVDKTIRICKEYTSKVFIRPYVGEAEPHRPFTFSKATGEWILWIDQDEQLTPQLRKAIPHLIERDDANAFSFVWPVKYANANLTKGIFSKVQKTVLFRKNAVDNFRGLPNEILHVTGKTIRTNYRMIHNQEGERNTLRVFFRKTLRIVRIHADQMLKKKVATKIAPWYFFKAFLWFFLYCGYYYIFHATLFTKADRSIALQLALYNFYLYWYIFLAKIGVWKHVPGR